MGPYLEVIDIRVLELPPKGFQNLRIPHNLIGDEIHYEEWNA
jgi:hypothetical protein